MNHLLTEQTFFKARRKEFPQIDNSLIYLDSAATTLKPTCVIDCLTKFYSKEYATVHRSIYDLAKNASERFWNVRTLVKKQLNARAEEEIIFTKNATDSLNMVADLLCQRHIKAGTKVIISQMEHHSNFVPWQMACERTGANLVVLPLSSDLSLDLTALEKELHHGKTAVVSLCHISNILGTINPIQHIATLCHKANALLVVDGAQSAPHLAIDVQALDCDFFAFSAHKMYGPTGVGVLWGKQELLDKLPPTRGGGGMIESVSIEKTTYGPVPTRFEAGTPAIAEIIAFGEALSFLQTIGQTRIAEWEQSLTSHLRKGLKRLSGIQLIGDHEKRGPLQSMAFTQAHPMDVATLLDLKGFAVRTGHLCGQPLLEALHLSSVLRVSFGLYNTFEECDLFLEALEDVLKKL